jgi:ornithine cyclodeaminase/alanine dehydrogenase-like protein (mu-crystallin family)
VLVNPFGMAIADIALAHHVFRAARALQLGLPLPR